MSNEEIQRIIREIDYQGNGKINYSEFLSATLNLSTFMTESKLKSIFYLFDTDQSGFITADNIKFAFQKLGQEVPVKVIQELIKKHDLKKDGVISYEEFRQIFFTDDDKFG